jgi:plastocyanin
MKTWHLTPVLVVALAGCGGGNSNSSSSSPPPAPATPPAMGGGQTLHLMADPNALAFNKKTLTAKAGQVTIDMKNPSATPHNIAVEGGGIDKDGEIVSQGGTSQITVTLKPGKYTFYCSVPGHRQAGMQGTLTVK